MRQIERIERESPVNFWGAAELFQELLASFVFQRGIPHETLPQWIFYPEGFDIRKRLLEKTFAEESEEVVEVIVGRFEWKEEVLRLKEVYPSKSITSYYNKQRDIVEARGRFEKREAPLIFAHSQFNWMSFSQTDLLEIVKDSIFRANLLITPDLCYLLLKTDKAERFPSEFVEETANLEFSRFESMLGPEDQGKGEIWQESAGVWSALRNLGYVLYSSSNGHTFLKVSA